MVAVQPVAGLEAEIARKTGLESAAALALALAIAMVSAELWTQKVRQAVVLERRATMTQKLTQTGNDYSMCLRTSLSGQVEEGVEPWVVGTADMIAVVEWAVGVDTEVSAAVEPHIAAAADKAYAKEYTESDTAPVVVVAAVAAFALVEN